MRTHTGPGDPGTKHFILADQLGSTSTVLSATGAVEESQKYYPFGAPRSGDITLTDKKFTGQQEEPAMWGEMFGLYNYGARFYSGTLGRFLSADPFASLNPQSFDRYSYVRNNPLRYIDPTGYMTSSDETVDSSDIEASRQQRRNQLEQEGWSEEQIDILMNGTPEQIRAVMAAGPANSCVSPEPAPVVNATPAPVSTPTPANASYTPVGTPTPASGPGAPVPPSADPMFQPAPVPTPTPSPNPALEPTPSSHKPDAKDKIGGTLQAVGGFLKDRVEVIEYGVSEILGAFDPECMNKALRVANGVLGTFDLALLGDDWGAGAHWAMTGVEWDAWKKDCGFRME